MPSISTKRANPHALSRSSVVTIAGVRIGRAGGQMEKYLIRCCIPRYGAKCENVGAHCKGTKKGVFDINFLYLMTW